MINALSWGIDTMALIELQPVSEPMPRNPAMGWSIYIDQDGTSLLEDGLGRTLDPEAFWRAMEPALPHASQLYIRLPWSEFEPEQGRYAWEHNPRFIAILDGARARSLRLAFRWYTDGRDCHRQATPDYVRAAGAVGDTLPSDRPGPVDGRWWWTPWSDDPILHRCLGEFVRAFADRFDDVDLTDLVDHGLGRWGEMHSFVFADMSRYQQSAPRVLLNMAKLHRDAFTEVIRCHNFIGWGGDRRVEDEVLFGLGHCIRRDGLGSPRWFNRTESELAASYWPRVPVFGENCYWHWKDSPGWIGLDGFTSRRTCLEQVFADARTVHANTLDLRTVDDIGIWLGEAPDLVERFRREAGYGLLPTVIELPETTPPAGATFTIRHFWRNLGWGVLPNRGWGGRVAAALALLDDHDQPAAVFRSLADPGNWIAGAPHSCLDHFTMPPLPRGVYRWAVALVDRFRDDRPWITLAVHRAPPYPAWLPLGSLCTIGDAP
jgi:hypothetical protein